MKSRAVRRGFKGTGGCGGGRYLPSEVFVAAADEGFHFAVGDGALEHPETAIGMDPLHATGADFFLHGFDARGDFVGGLDVVDLDVDHADAEGDFLVDMLERIEVAGGAVGEFEDEVVGVEGVEEIEQGLPVTLLDGLAAVVTEAEMDGALGLFVDAVEDKIHRGGSEGAVLRVAGDVGFVDLHAGGGETGHLGGEDFAEGHGELVEAAIVVVEECAREHVGARDGEFEITAGDGRGALAIGEEIERAFAEGAGDDTGGLAAEAHRVMAGELLGDGATDLAVDAGHGTDEILDHAVRVGMVDVETVKFAVGRKVDAGLGLDVEHDAGGVDDGLLGGERGEPVRDRIGADGGGEDAWFGHKKCEGLKWCGVGNESDE